MDPFSFLASVMQPPWSYALAVVALALLAVPRIIELYGGWVDLRLGRRQLDLEKERLDLLKLRYEIEAIRKQHRLPQLEDISSAPAQMAPSPATRRSRPQKAAPTSAPEAAPAKSAILRWLVAHPAISVPLLWMLQIFLGFVAATFGLTALVIPITLFTAGEGGREWGFTLLAIVLYGLLTWGSLVAYRAVRRARMRVVAKQT